MSNVSKLQNSFKEGLGLADTSKVLTLKYREISEWDSLGHMQLVSQLENDFDVMLETQEVIDLSSFSKAIEILSKHGVEIEA